MKKTIALICISFLMGGCWEKAKGEKIGTLVKIANEGFWWKTHEGELIRGGMNDGSGSIGKSFHFTIERDDIFEIAQKAMNDNKQVHIYVTSTIICPYFNFYCIIDLLRIWTCLLIVITAAATHDDTCPNAACSS